MRLIKTVLLASALLGVVSSAFGACVRSGAAGENSFTWGNTKADSYAAVGARIGPENTKEIKSQDYYRGCEGSYKLTGSFEPNGNFDPVTNTYPTGVRGVGVRVTITKGNESYVVGAGPMGFNITPTSAKRINLSGFVIKGELIKTSSMIDPGPLTGLAGVVAKIYLEGFENSNPVSIIAFDQSTASIISNPSCSLLSSDGRNLTVTLPPVKLTAFNKVGAHDGETRANFKLKCQGGYDKITTQVYTEFKSASGEYGGDLGMDIGVLANEAEGNQTARDIGIQVMTGGEPIMFEGENNYGEFTGEEGTVDYNMTARYYQYGDNPSGGKVVSRMIYTLTYQ